MTHKTGVGATLAALLAAAAAATASAAPTQPYDAHWLQSAVASHRFEIAAGKLAARRSRNGHVSALAGRLISDHAVALRQDLALARRLGVRTAGLTPSMQWDLHALRTLSQARFAREYAALEIDHHNQDIVLWGQEVRSGRDPEVRKQADSESQVLARHLRLARQVLRAL
jgi:predicted outer membrane protein